MSRVEAHTIAADAAEMLQVIRATDSRLRRGPVVSAGEDAAREEFGDQGFDAWYGGAYYRSAYFHHAPVQGADTRVSDIYFAEVV
jgi:hypothetical protein